MIAALYVESGGVYFGLPDVDPWDEERDARLYDGPHPVVAHPPCNRYSKLAAFRKQRDGRDGGCFAAALDAVRRYGGVLEHPAHSLAWQIFDLPRPMNAGWTISLLTGGASCLVDQAWYGHECNKPTWLYVEGCTLPTLIWGRHPRTAKNIQENYGGGPRQALRSATPPAFRDVLLGIARSSVRADVVAA